MDRRTFLALSVGTLPALAGCAGDEGEDATTTTTESGTATTRTTATSTETATTAEPTDDSTTEEPTTTEPANSLNVDVGTLIEGEGMVMVVEAVEETDEVDGYPQPESGNAFVVVRLAVTNTTEDTFIDFDGFLDTQLQDEAGATYQLVVASTPNAFEGGQLAPGEIVRDALVYELPEDSSGLVLHFDFEDFEYANRNAVTVDLGTRAAIIDGLEQGLQVPVHAIGESVSQNEVRVSVNSARFETDLGDNTAAAGTEYAVVDITTANSSGTKLPLGEPHLMVAKDGAGNVYPRHTATATLDGSYPETGSLSPGESRRGMIAYGVPEGRTPLYWVVEFSKWEAGTKSFWQLR